MATFSKQQNPDHLIIIYISLPAVIMLCFQKLLLQCVFLEVICLNDDYKIILPTSISALKGSCVVIPCEFSIPDHEKYAESILGMWHSDNWEYVSHPDSSKVVTRFKKRTALIGDLQKHDCSLKIDEVKVDDIGPFCFRFDVPGIVKGSYLKHVVLMHITDSPDVPSINCLPELKAGVDLAVTCSVPHTCLTNPPNITWSYTKGTFTVYHNKTGNGAWQVYSVLKFIPLASDHKSRLTCTAKYWGGKQADAAVLLNVTYRPKNVNIEYKESRVKEGASIDLRCASDSYPPASSYQWYNVIGDQTLRLPQTSATIYVQNVSRKSRAFFCTSQNSEGLTNSTTVRLNVEYKPEILSESACTLDITGQLTCQCIVDSNPPPEIEWSVSGSNLNESNTGLKSFSINNSRGQQNTVTKVLQGWVPFTGNLSCSATNTQGKASMSFKRPMSDLYIYIAIAVAAILIIAIGAGLCRLRVKRNERKKDDPKIAFVNNYEQPKPERKTETQDDVMNDIYENVQAIEVDEDIYVNVNANK